MKLIYVAGPFRGPTPWDVEQNIRRAEAVALGIWEMGAAALCPHTNTRFFDKTATDKTYLDGTLEMLRRCDAVVMLQRYTRSQGALNEQFEAQRLGLPIFYEVPELEKWLDDVDPTRSVTPLSDRKVELHTAAVGGVFALGATPC
jgi:hypothetical protein